MSKIIRLPIRFKILVTLLFIISVVVGVITFTMARSFHQDKTSYIHDLTSVIAVHTAERTRSLFEGYRGRMRMYLLILQDRNMTEEQKAEKIEALFAEFSDFLAISVYDGDGNPESTVYDERSLTNVGLSKDDLLAYRDRLPIPWQEIRSGDVHIERSSVESSLPCVTMTMAEHDKAADDWVVASAVLRLDGVRRLAARSGVFETYIVDSKGELLAHVNPTGEATDGRLSHLAGMIDEIRGFGAGMTKEYEVNGEDMVGGFAASKSGLIAGVQIPKKAAYLASRSLLETLVITAFCMLGISALAVLFWSHLMTRPIERLSEAALAVGRGQFDVQVDVKTKDEIGVLGRSFNQMASELKARDRALVQAQKAMIQSEKMAAFGVLGAGIAHEVKNPLAGILGCAQLSLRSVKDEKEAKNLRLIEKEARRCKDIIENLLKFARLEKTEQKAIDVSEVLKDAAAIVHHQLEVNQVTLEQEIEEDLPPIIGNANQLQQVVINLVINAQQAMERDGGTVVLSAQRWGDGKVVVRVKDDGPGIPPEQQEKIFDPFFTTKGGKKGTGLGLSVSYGIVKDHKGDITVESEPGVGTIFMLLFPVASPDAGEAGPLAA